MTLPKSKADLGRSILYVSIILPIIGLLLTSNVGFASPSSSGDYFWYVLKYLGFTFAISLGCFFGTYIISMGMGILLQQLNIIDRSESGKIITFLFFINLLWFLFLALWHTFHAFIGELFPILSNVRI